MLTATVEGYNNGSFIGSSVFNLSSTSYTNFSANLLGVDEIRFLNDGVSTYRYWLADNFGSLVISVVLMYYKTDGYEDTQRA